MLAAFLKPRIKILVFHSVFQPNTFIDRGHRIIRYELDHYVSFKSRMKVTTCCYFYSFHIGSFIVRAGKEHIKAVVL